MKVNFTIELTPQEARELAGLPNVTEFNQKIIQTFENKIKDGYNPQEFFKLLHNNPMMEIFQTPYSKFLTKIGEKNEN